MTVGEGSFFGKKPQPGQNFSAQPWRDPKTGQVKRTTDYTKPGVDPKTGARPLPSDSSDDRMSLKRAMGEKKRASVNMTDRVMRQRQAKREGWVEKIFQAVPGIAERYSGKNSNDIEKAFDLAFNELDEII